MFIGTRCILESCTFEKKIILWNENINIINSKYFIPSYETVILYLHDKNALKSYFKRFFEKICILIIISIFLNQTDVKMLLDKFNHSPRRNCMALHWSDRTINLKINLFAFFLFADLKKSLN